MLVCFLIDFLCLSIIISRTTLPSHGASTVHIPVGSTAFEILSKDWVPDLLACFSLINKNLGGHLRVRRESARSGAAPCKQSAKEIESNEQYKKYNQASAGEKTIQKLNSMQLWKLLQFSFFYNLSASTTRRPEILLLLTPCLMHIMAASHILR